jgi:malate permease and related proteins
MPLLALAPIFVYFLAGMALHRAGLASRDQGAFLFRVIFFVTLPALAFDSISRMQVSGHTALLPLSAMIADGACMVAAIAFARRNGLPSRNAGALVLGAGITNMTFLFPFVFTVLGEQGLANAILFDSGNAVFVATIGYLVALGYGDAGTPSAVASLMKTLRTPLFIAIAAAIVVNLAGISLPAVIGKILSPLGKVTMPLVLIALGIVFSPGALRGKLPAYALLFRMPLGFAVGLLLVWVLGLDGLLAAVIVGSAGAPIGFSSVTLASVADMDVEQAVGALSMSVGLGLFTSPLLLWAASAWFGAGP